MTWFKVDDGFPMHPKVEALEEHGRAVHAQALALWLLAGADCARREEGDGTVTMRRLKKLVPWPPKRAAFALVSCGFWLRIDDESFRFKDWTDYQPDAAAIKNRKAQYRESKRKSRNVHVDTPPDDPVDTTVDATLRAHHPVPVPVNQTDLITQISRSPTSQGPPPNGGVRVFRDPLRESLESPAAERLDVRQVHAAWAESLGWTGAKLRPDDARILGERIDEDGLEACLHVARVFVADPVVANGTSTGHKPRSVRYVFGNAEAFDRIRQLEPDASPPVTAASLEALQVEQARLRVTRDELEGRVRRSRMRGEVDKPVESSLAQCTDRLAVLDRLMRGTK